MGNNTDKWVDDTLEKCILTVPRKSFFLFAGAGSGKTHSLVMLLAKIAVFRLHIIMQITGLCVIIADIQFQ